MPVGQAYLHHGFAVKTDKTSMAAAKIMTANEAACILKTEKGSISLKGKVIPASNNNKMSTNTTGRNHLKNVFHVLGKDFLFLLSFPISSCAAPNGHTYVQ